MVGASCAVVALGVRSAIRSSDWASDEIFYRRTLAAGGSTARVMANLAQVYSTKGDYGKAEEMFRKVLARNPDYPLARSNLAEIFARQGKAIEAEALLASTSKATSETKKDYPRTWIPLLNLAIYRRKAKDNAGALSLAEKARQDYPGVWEIVRFESEVLRETKGPDAALPLLEDFRAQNWWHHGAALALGRLYMQKGDTVHAVQVLHRASWLDVHDAESLNLIAKIHLGQNHFTDACLAQRRAVSRQPDEPRQYALLSNILEKMGKEAEARDALAHATRLQNLVKTPGIIN
jgi:Flp pilus assembly protein TadD